MKDVSRCVTKTKIKNWRFTCILATEIQLWMCGHVQFMLSLVSSSKVVNSGTWFWFQFGLCLKEQITLCHSCPPSCSSLFSAKQGTIQTLIHSPVHHHHSTVFEFSLIWSVCGLSACQFVWLERVPLFYSWQREARHIYLYGMLQVGNSNCEYLGFVSCWSLRLNQRPSDK